MEQIYAGVLRGRSGTRSCGYAWEAQAKNNLLDLEVAMVRLNEIIELELDLDLELEMLLPIAM